jgi:hypothetical protein
MEKPRIRVYVSLATGECSLGLFDALLWWPHSPLALNLNKL